MFRQALRKAYFAAAIVNNKLYIHGGTNNKNTFEDIVAFDFAKNELLVYNHISAARAKPAPAMAHHQMVALNNALCIIGSRSDYGNLGLYFVQNCT